MKRAWIDRLNAVSDEIEASALHDHDASTLPQAEAMMAASQHIQRAISELEKLP